MGIAATTGITSGIDYESLISDLAEVEQAKIDDKSTEQAAYESKISIYGTLKSSLVTFQEAVDALSSSDDLFSSTATSSDEDILTVKVTDTAKTGTYQLTVSQIAKQEILIGGSNFSSEDATVGSGTISLTLGDGAAVEIEIGEDQNTLEGIAEAINDADAGVTASIVQISDGAYALSLTADESGQSIAFAVTADGDDDTTDTTGLSALYADAAEGTMTVAQANSTAIFSLGSQAFERSTNTIDDLIAGVTINLEGTESGTTVTIHVTTDASGLGDKVQAMVDSYNSFLDTLATYQDDSDEDNIGVLFGDTLANRLKSKLAGMFFTEVDTGDSAISYLSNIGVSMGSEGQLEFDEDVLENALETDQSAVMDLFTDEDGGFAVSMGTVLDAYLDSDGVFDTKTDGLQSTVDSLEEKIADMEEDLADYEERLKTQFAALEATLTNLESTKDTVTSLIDSLTSSDD